jgi:hypothetical protein
MNLARLFQYTLDGEIRIAELTAANDALIIQAIGHAAEVKEFYREIRSLRRSHVALVDRRAVREGIIPPSESLTRPKLTEEQTAERTKTVESVRRSGPVAKTRSDAEAEYLKDPEAYAAAH